jgi:hypothetical protein
VRATKIGTATVSATAGEATASGSFTATQPLPASRLEKVSGDGSACPTQSTGCTFVVRAVDVNGVPVPGTAVQWSSPTVCGPSKVLQTDVLGLSTAVNLCSTVPAGTYSQVATLLTNQQQASFSFSLVGLVLSLESFDSAGVATYTVTSTAPASGLSLSVNYVSGPVAGYVDQLSLNRTVTPALMKLGYPAAELPFADYTFEVIVSTTTPGIGPGVETITFNPQSFYFKQPNAQRRPTPIQAPAAPRAP